MTISATATKPFFQAYSIDVSSGQGTSSSVPPGYQRKQDIVGKLKSGSSTGSQQQEQEETQELFDRRTAALQNLAFSPLKQVFMTSFMMYMAGSNLHFFSILTVINGMYSPMNAILNSGNAFRQIPGSRVDVISPRIMFCGIHFLGLLFAIYRVNMMGLLPTHVSDWLSLIQANKVSGMSSTGIFRI